MNNSLSATLAFVNRAVNKGQQRSVKAKKNILASFVIKGIGIAVSLLLVPLTIHYVNPSRYGVWLTISSIVGWFSFFDIGLTQGLRNKFAEAKAKGDDDLAQTYVSTTYAILIIISCFVWIIFMLSNQFLNWSSMLNIPAGMEKEVSILAIIVFTYFCLQFVLKIITSVITADQQPAKSSAINVLGQVLSLLLIFILVKTTHGSLIKLGVALCISPVFILLGANLFFFRSAYKKYQPKLSRVRFSHIKGLFNLGLLFFIIEIAVVVQFETANVIIARNFGTTHVTAYNIVYKYFGLLNMVFTIFLIPFWSASTEAFLKKDMEWIKKGIKKYNMLNILLAGTGVIMLIFSEKIYTLWLGKGTISIAWSLSLWGFLYFNVLIFGGKYVNFLNGISALRLQLYTSLISPIIFLGVAIFLIKYYHLGVYSLFIASIIANFNAYLLAPIQYYQIIHRNKKGIWVK